MTRLTFSALILALLLPASQAAAAEDRRCRFELAIYTQSQPRKIRRSVVIDAERHKARVRVTRSGSWGADRQTLSNGIDVITFDTATTRETLRIRPTGHAQWDIQYKRPPAAKDHVKGYAGRCGDWRRKK
ncbi:hypothetical protein FHY55_10860 [Oceanicola sp. D3]|uniref:hypothetical protein n=1 Tax=Oceanicola sp. D3 TaxID=2587163 RepID=UPI00112158AE|nr:hypothetical protein [Oceanicola sp. D3]QDC09714.1 hypothetical protein FHY55_10860 [Oceanicola sp. D3]